MGSREDPLALVEVRENLFVIIKSRWYSYTPQILVPHSATISIIDG